MSNYIHELQEMIKKLHGVDSKHIESIPVRESFNGKTVWDGVVELFEVIKHPKAKECYAWSHREGKDGKDTRYYAVLAIHPVDSPRKAVQAMIASEFRKKAT